MFSNHNASMASRVRLLEFDRDNSRAGTDRPFENLISAAVYLDALFRKNYILYAFTGRFAEKLRDLSHVWAWDIDVVIQAPTARVLNIVGSQERLVFCCYRDVWNGAK